LAVSSDLIGFEGQRGWKPGAGNLGSRGSLEKFQTLFGLLLAYSYLCTQMMKDSVRQQLFRKLKKENCFWSYDMSKMKSIKEKGFKEQLPVYDVTPNDIQEYIKQKLLEIK